MADVAYVKAREMVLCCDLGPGALVTATQLSDLAGLGRAPIYEALLRLESERFVSPLKRRGWQVAPLTLQGVTQIFEAWRFVALLLTQLAIEHATHEEVRSLFQLARNWRPSDTAGTEGDVRSALANAPFDQFRAISGNPVVAEMTRGACAHFERAMNFTFLNGMWPDAEYFDAHDAVEAAVIGRDATAAQQAMGRFVDLGEQKTLGFLRRMAPVMTAPLVAADG